MRITAIIIVLEKWDTAVIVEGMTTGKFRADSTHTVLHNLVGIDGTEDPCAIPVNLRLAPIDTPEMVREFFHKQELAHRRV
jgi:hypothetical protein